MHDVLVFQKSARLLKNRAIPLAKPNGADNPCFLNRVINSPRYLHRECLRLFTEEMDALFGGGDFHIGSHISRHNRI